MGTLWKIDQLSQLVAQALELASYEGQDSARVRAVPDVRTIRYYTTVGLLDRPQEMQGRTALYGRRHVLQLVAVKKLQAQGMSLVDVQQTLAGATNRKLMSIAGLTADFFERAEAELDRETTLKVKRQKNETVPAPATVRKFWTETPICSDVDHSQAESNVAPRAAVILPVQTGVSVVIDSLATAQLREDWINEVRPALELLREALDRARVTKDTSNTQRNDQAR
jgi:DNA-binding transcriptional MerR regulator